MTREKTHSQERLTQKQRSHTCIQTLHIQGNIIQIWYNQAIQIATVSQKKTPNPLSKQLINNYHTTTQKQEDTITITSCPF